MKIVLTVVTAFTLLAAFLPEMTSADDKILRHVVIFKFKDTATPAQIKEITHLECRPSGYG
jgi:hypothetical protein